MPLRFSCYPNTSKQSRRLAGAGRGGGARVQRAPRGARTPARRGGGAATKGPDSRPRAARGGTRAGTELQRSPLEGDGPARLQAPTSPEVGSRRLAEVPDSGRALSAGSKRPGYLHIPRPQTRTKARICSGFCCSSCSRSCPRLPALSAEKEVCPARTQ